MSAADRPWWSTPGGDLDEGAHVDPVEAHRRARRGDAVTPDDATPDDATPDDATPDDATAGSETAPDDGSWWVPATEAVTRFARDLAASATTTGGHDAAGTERPRRDADDSAGRGGRAGGEDEDGGGRTDGATHRIDACGVCPICVGIRVLGDARPDLVAHLTEAARHLALAVRTVVDAAADGDEAADPGGTRVPRRGPRQDGLQHIDLDDS